MDEKFRQLVGMVREMARTRLAEASAVRVAKAVDELMLLNALESEAAAARHVAILSVIDRLPAEEIEPLARRLMRPFDPEARKAAALLVGASGGEPGLIGRWLEDESDWLVKQHQKLALVMLGRPPEAFVPENLFVRRDVSRYAVIWTMLHAGRIDGLDELFDPLGPDSGLLRHGLDSERFWYVLRRYLPPEAPGFDLWADPAVQQLQSDLLRSWYLMNRSRLRFDEAAGRFALEK